MGSPHPHRLEVIGAPTSAASFAPGQEKAPSALRDAGLIAALTHGGWEVEDRGDLPGFRWIPDRAHRRAQNVEPTIAMIQAVETATRAAADSGAVALVLGGDCTIELGVLAGLAAPNTRVGLVYIDMHPDLNTPDTVDDGALDWMGMAHALAVPGSIPSLASACGRSPLIAPADVAYVGIDPERCTAAEIERLRTLGIRVLPVAQVAPDPGRAAHALMEVWAAGFDRLAVHLDVDVLDFVDLPISEEGTRNRGLTFRQLTALLAVFLRAVNLRSFTVTELNPDHAEPDGNSLRRFVEGIGWAFDARQSDRQPNGRW